MSDAMKERVMEAAGVGYLTDAQIVAVVRELTRTSRARAPEDVGIPELMQLIELVRTGGLDDADYEYQEPTHNHPSVAPDMLHKLPQAS